MKAWIKRWGPAVVIMAIIFVASAIPGSGLPDFGYRDTLVKKGGHMLGYALLAVSYLHGLNNVPRGKTIRFAAAFCLTTLYAISDEWHQGFTPGRSPSFLDVIIDGAGGLIGLSVWHLIRTRVAARHKAH